MNKPFLALCMSALTVGVLSVQAQTTTSAPEPAPAAPSVSLTVTPTYASQYMFRGQRLGGQSFEPSVEADYGNWALGVWANTPISDKVPGQSDPEIDPYGSYTFAVSNSLSVVPGFTWYTYPRAPLDQGFYRMTFEPNVTVNYTIAGVRLSPEVFYDVVLKGPTYQFSAAYAIPLKDIGSELDFLGTAGTYLLKDVINNSIPDTKAWGNYWLAGVSAPFVITKNSKLTVGWAYTKGTDAFLKQAGIPKAVNTSAVGRGVATVSYAWTF